MIYFCRMVGYQLKSMTQPYTVGEKKTFDRGITEIGFGQDTRLEPSIDHHCFLSLDKLLNTFKPHFHHL